MIPILAACVAALAEAASAGGVSVITRILDSVFDPAWNIANRGVIWSAIVGTLFLAGFGLPIPEDIPLTLAGFTTHKQAGDRIVLADLVLTYILVVIPILLGDIGAWTLGRRFGLEIRDRLPFLRRVITEPRLARVRCWFRDYGNFTVFLGRQVAGVRFVTFFSAGAVRMPLSRFIFFDFLGCLVSVPCWLLLGCLASWKGREWLKGATTAVGSGFALGAVGVFVLFYATVKLRARRRRAARAAAPGAAPVPGMALPDT